MNRDEADTHDKEPNLWSSIGLQAAMILNRLRLQAQISEKQRPDNETDADENHRRPEGGDRETERAKISVGRVDRYRR
jgi:hypothetical protein